ncbi:MAG: hypothetical protein ACLFVU_03850 [Phycisphaerae bacterium]
MKGLIVAVLLGLMVFAGCGTHNKLSMKQVDFARGGFVDEETAERLRNELTDGDIAKLLDANVKVNLPTSIALARLESPYGQQFHLADISADEMERWNETVEEMDQFTGISPVTSLSMNQPNGSVTMKQLRQAAAQMQCELLLAYVKTDSSVDNYNDAAALYWTGVGLFLVPGNVYEHRTVMQAALVDVRTGMILGTASGDSHKKRTYPAAFKQIQADKLSRETPDEALTDLQAGARGVLQRLHRQALASRRPAEE